MARNNVRVPTPPPIEPYDVKNRIVGGIVLCILMLLLYVVLKALLGINATGADYALRAPLPDEITDVELAQENNALQTAQPKYPIINKFVFLDLDGQPMENATGTIELAGLSADVGDDTHFDDVVFDGSDGKEWYVQAASFKQRDRAQTMQKKLKDNGFESRIVKIGDWYGVRLLPQDTRGEATQQLRALKRLGITGQRRRIKVE